MIFVDTNYFLRFLLSDIPKEHKEAKRLFLTGAGGKIKLFTSLIVIFEVYWVLTSFYGKDKNQITKILQEILNLEFVKIGERKLLQQALTVYRHTNLDLEDAFNLVYARGKKAKEFRTFDKKLGKIFLSALDKTF